MVDEKIWENDPMVKKIFERNLPEIKDGFFSYSENGAKGMIADAILFAFMHERKRLIYQLINSFEKRINDIKDLPINHPLKNEQANYLAGIRECLKELYILISAIERGGAKNGRKK